MPDKAWKASERKIARVLGGYRIKRGADFSKSDPDVALPQLPFLKIDSKHRTRGVRQLYNWFEEVLRKYCKGPDDTPMVVVHEHGRQRWLAVVDLEFMAELLKWAFEEEPPENPGNKPQK